VFLTLTLTECLARWCHATGRPNTNRDSALNQSINQSINQLITPRGLEAAKLLQWNRMQKETSKTAWRQENIHTKIYRDIRMQLRIWLHINWELTSNKCMSKSRGINFATWSILYHYHAQRTSRTCNEACWRCCICTNELTKSICFVFEKRRFFKPHLRTGTRTECGIAQISSWGRFQAQRPRFSNIFWFCP